MASVNELNAGLRGRKAGLERAAVIANQVLVEYRKQEVQYDGAIEAAEAIRNLILMELQEI